MDDGAFRKSLQEARAAGDAASLRALFQSQTVPKWANLDQNLKETFCNAVEKAVIANDTSRARELLSEWSSTVPLGPPDAGDFIQTLPKAVMAGNRELVKLLIEYGARANENLASYMNERVTADDETFENILQDLKEAGWEFKDSTILANAASSETDERLFKWLLKNGASTDIPDAIKTTPMTYIAKKGTLASLELLLDSGAEVDNNALLAAVRREIGSPERVPMVQLLLSRGADVNFLEPGFRKPSSSALKASIIYRYTPLFEAVRKQDVEMVELLLANGADVNLKVQHRNLRDSSPLELMLASSSCEDLREMGERIQEGIAD